MCSIEEKTQVIVFTSLIGGRKDLCASNLAASLVLMYKKVVLVDLDIRKGTLSGRTAHTGKGVTHFLSGKVDSISEIIQKDGLIEGLDMVNAGPVPPNPAELLLSDRLDLLIDELRAQYDYVIIDNVPAGVVADASIVNRVADLTICVVRAGVMDRRQLPELERLYRTKQFHNMSIVLNCIGTKRLGGYGYGYGVWLRLRLWLRADDKRRSGNHLPL